MSISFRQFYDVCKSKDRQAIDDAVAAIKKKLLRIDEETLNIYLEHGMQANNGLDWAEIKYYCSKGTVNELQKTSVLLSTKCKQIGSDLDPVKIDHFKSVLVSAHQVYARFKQAALDFNLDDLFRKTEKWHWRGALETACINGNIEIVKVLLEYIEQHKSSDNFHVRWGYVREVGRYTKRGLLQNRRAIMDLLKKAGNEDHIDGFRGACEGGDMEMIHYMERDIERERISSNGKNDFLHTSQVFGFINALSFGQMHVMQYLLKCDPTCLQTMFFPPYLLKDISEHGHIDAAIYVIEMPELRQMYREWSYRYALKCACSCMRSPKCLPFVKFMVNKLNDTGYYEEIEQLFKGWNFRKKEIPWILRLIKTLGLSKRYLEQKLTGPQFVNYHVCSSKPKTFGDLYKKTKCCKLRLWRLSDLFTTERHLSTFLARFAEFQT